MNISSMTGFGRASGEYKNFTWFFEVKSVNAKGLDVKCKLPSWLESASIDMKNAAGKHFVRGNIGVYLDVSSSASEVKAKINEELLKTLTDRAVVLYEENGGKLNKPSPSEILGLRGVIEIAEEKLDEKEQEELQKKILKSFDEACKSLVESRLLEGSKIKKALLEIISKIEKIVVKVEKIASGMPAKMKEKLMQQIKALKETNITEERLAQEAVILVTRADIKEEIDRLHAHIKTAKELLEAKDAVGRKLDFLCQELNREANTTCSKSFDIELTNLGMELKTLIEQFREQVQNIE